VRPGIAFRPNWHLEATAHKLHQVASGRCRRLIITMPPRNLKSLMTSVALPAWLLGHQPAERAVVISYSDTLARSLANDFRLVVRDEQYQRAFPAMRVARESDRELTTTRRGRRLASSIEGTLTGFGGNLIVIDDPLKTSDAMSEAVRARVIDWYRSTLLSRGDDKQKTRIVLVMQRVNELDLAGYLIEQGGFELLDLPAIAQRDEVYDLGDGRQYHRVKGEILHPSHEPAEVLAELRREMGPIAFSAQYQQKPIPFGGKIVKRKWLARYDRLNLEPGDRILLSWDIALTESGTGDYSAGLVLIQRGERFYVFHVVRGRFPFDTLKSKILELRAQYGGSALLIEESPISYGLIQAIRQKGINVVKIKPNSDKQARLIAQSDLFAGGSILLPQKAAWLEEFEAELLAFPGRFDDQVDALTQALAWARQRSRVGARPVIGMI
jgi:predicted phage terminase large subunit-like protein